MDVPITADMLVAKLEQMAVRLMREELRSAALDAKVNEQSQRIAELEQAPPPERP